MKFKSIQDAARRRGMSLRKSNDGGFELVTNGNAVKFGSLDEVRTEIATRPVGDSETVRRYPKRHDQSIRRTPDGMPNGGARRDA